MWQDRIQIEKDTLCWAKGWDFREPLNSFKLSYVMFQKSHSGGTGEEWSDGHGTGDRQTRIEEMKQTTGRGRGRNRYKRI